MNVDAAAELGVRVVALKDDVQAIVITDHQSYQLGAAGLRTIKAYMVRVAEVFDPIVRAAKAAHQTALDQRKKLEAPALELERELKGRMEAWDRAERERLQAEQARAAAAAQEEAQVAAMIDAERRGDEGAVQTLAEGTPASVAVFAPPPPPAPKAEGVSYRSTFTVEVVDLAALVRAVAAGQAPLAYLQPNMPVLNQAARALKESLHVPGIRVIAGRTVSVRP